MPEIFDEIDEDLRRENLRKLWEKFSGVLIGGALVIIVGVGGWRGYEYLEHKKAVAAGADFDRAVELVEAKKLDEAKSAFAKVAAEAPAGYRTLAQLREAAAVAASDKAAAVKLYDAIANDSAASAADRDLARVRAAALLIDTAGYNDILGRLESAAGGTATYRHTAREQLALSAWRNNDQASTRKWTDLIINDAETPQSLRGRAEALQALLPAAAKS